MQQRTTRAERRVTHKKEEKGSFWSRKLTDGEWARLHDLPDFKLLLDWLAQDHPRRGPEPKQEDTRPSPDAA